MASDTPPPASLPPTSVGIQEQRFPSVVVVSGGSAGNEVLDAFVAHFDKVSFILPVSDNGGSSSEIIRVLGGPSLGDIRSRLVRLIPETPDKAGIKALLAYRLPSSADVDDIAIKQEWLEIVEGSHPLWRSIPPDRREAIRAFLVHFEHAILRRAQRRFNFRSGSVGNFWYVIGIPAKESGDSMGGLSSQHSVIPAINTNSLVTIAAELEDGSRIVGQNEISHPPHTQSSSSDTGQHMVFAGSHTPAMQSSWFPDIQVQESGNNTGSSVTQQQQQLRSGAQSRLSNQSMHHPSHPHSSHSQDLRHKLLEQKAKQALAEDRDRSTRDSSPWGGDLSADLEPELDYDDSPGVIARTSWDITSHQDIDEGETSWDQPRRDVASPPHSHSGRSSAAGPHHNIIFSKGDEETGYATLPTRIHRIIYLNTYGQETFPAPSSAFLNSLSTSEVLVYSCGSLYTSLIPPLALSGVGNMVAMSPNLRYKILLLNGSYDRESDSLTAVDFVQAVTDHLNGSIRQTAYPPTHSPLSSSQILPLPGQQQSTHQNHHNALGGNRHSNGIFSPGDYVTHLFYLEQSSIPVDSEKLQEMQITPVKVSGSKFTDTSLSEAMLGVVGVGGGGGLS